MQTTPQRFYTVLSSMYSAVVLMTEEGRVEFVNPAFCRLFGLEDTPADLVGLSSSEFIERARHSYRHPDQASARVRQILDQGQPVRGEEVAMRNGRTCLRDFLPLNVQGKSCGRLWLHVDISDRKKAEAVLRESESQYRLLFASNPSPMWVFDEETLRIVAVNDAAIQHYGWSSQEFLAMSVLDVRPAEDWASAREIIERRRGADEIPIGMVRHCRKDGTPMEMELSVSAIHFSGRPARLCSMNDVTARRRSEEASRRYELVTQESRDILLFVRGDDGRILEANPAAAAAYGCSRDELLELTIHDLRALGTPRLTDAQLGEAHARGLLFESVHRHRDGSTFPVEVSARGVVIGETRTIVSVVRDITERKRADEALRTAHAGLEQKVRERTAELEVANRVLRMISACNEALVRATDEPELIRQICQTIHDQGGFRMVWVGYAEDDAGKTLRPVASAGFEDDYLGTARITWADEERGRGPTGMCIRAQAVQVCHDFITDASVLPWRDDALERGYRSSIALPLRMGGLVFGALTIYASAPGAFDDGQVELLTELADDLSLGITARRAQIERDQARREAEDRAEQLRALATELGEAEQRERGRLARVIHDHLQQLLVGAKLNLAVGPKADARSQRQAARRAVGLLDQAISEARSLTADLSLPVLRERGLVAGVEWLSQQVKHQHRLKVAVKADAQAEPATETIRIFLFDAVRELLFNVVKHSGSDRATVEIRRSALDQVQVVVADSGVGFDPRQLKAGGSFGLFSIRERLRHLGGQLDVESSPGKGSRFTMNVPAGLEQPSDRGGPIPPAGSATPPLAVAESRSGGKIRILLADDHPAMRQGLSRLFGEQPDFEVVGEAGDGIEAVELTRRLRPDLVLMDVSMPRASGLEATAQIASEFPGIRVIGLSMVASEYTAASMRKAGAVAYLAKGCPVEELMAAVRSCVGPIQDRLTVAAAGRRKSPATRVKRRKPVGKTRP